MPVCINENSGRNLKAVLRQAKTHSSTAQFQQEKNIQKPMFIKECKRKNTSLKGWDSN